MHFTMQRKTLKLYSQAQPSDNNFLVIMKALSLQRHLFHWRGFVSISSNLRMKINFAGKWLMRVFLEAHLVKEKISAPTAFISKKDISTILAAINLFFF